MERLQELNTSADQVLKEINQFLSKSKQQQQSEVEEDEDAALFDASTILQVKSPAAFKTPRKHAMQSPNHNLLSSSSKLVPIPPVSPMRAKTYPATHQIPQGTFLEQCNFVHQQISNTLYQIQKSGQ